MNPEYKAYWDSLKALALDLDLPGVKETASGNAALKAHGKLWVWWSPHEDAPVFKVPFEERDFLTEVDPETFFFTAHYRNHPMVLVHPDKLDPIGLGPTWSESGAPRPPSACSGLMTRPRHLNCERPDHGQNPDRRVPMRPDASLH
jgi:hypothetical protein